MSERQPPDSCAPDPCAYRTIVDASTTGTAIFDTAGHLSAANPAMSTLTGIAASELSAQALGALAARPLVGPTGADGMSAGWMQDVRPGDPPRRLRLTEDDGRPPMLVWSTELPGGGLALHLQPMAQPDHDPTMSGVPEAPAGADALTGLPDRDALLDVLDQMLGTVGGAVILADLDRFLTLNDTMGPDVGDAVIRAAAASLSTVLPAEATLARSGADEFTVVMPGADAGTAERAGEVMVMAVRNAALLGGTRTPRVTASVGVVVCPPAGASSSADVLALAEQSMRDARVGGRNRVVIGTMAQNPAAALAEQRDWVRRLDSLNVGLRAWMQPIVPLAVDDDIARYELLVRWSDEDGNVRSPGEFLDIAEASGVIEHIDRWMIQRAAMQALTATAPIQVTVNVAVSTLQNTGFSAWLYRTLRGVPEGSVMIEVTESEALGAPGALAEAIGAVKAAGCMVAVDDFGSGFATFKHLTALQVDVLKLDGAFVTDMVHNPTNRRIVAAMAALTDGLGIPMIAECVEDQATADLLIEMGVAWGQGYHFARPVPLPDLQGGIRVAEVLRELA